MKDSSGSEGFTIIETMIVLAVTGSMLLMAMLLINGRQQKTEFAQGTRDFQSRLQQVINEVSTGYFPAHNDFRCEPSPTGPLIRVTGTSKQQGTNLGCIFLGKTVQFAVGPSEPEVYNIYTVAALQSANFTSSIDLAAAKPRLIADDGSVPQIPDRYDTAKMPYGMKVVSVTYNNAPSYNPGQASIGAVGFASSLGTLDSSDKNQQVNVLAIPGTQLGQNATAGGAGRINANIQSSVINPPGGIQICVRSGSTDQTALYTIGGEGRQLTVGVAIKNSADCSG